MKASTTSLKTLKIIGVGLFWIGIWYVLALVINKELFLPYPHLVAIKFFELCFDPEFWITTATSLFRILRGFIYGIILGSACALLTYYVPLARDLIAPFLRTVRAVPVASFTLLAFLWLDNSLIPVFISLLMVLPIIWENLSSGLNSLDKGLLEMAKVYKISRGKTLTKIIAPQLKPHFFSGALTSLGLAWKSGIAAEVISYPKVAIGQAMTDAKTSLETSEMMVWTVVVVALSLLLELLLRQALKDRRAKS